MGSINIAYQAFRVARAIMRSTGLTKPLRRTVGPVASRMVYRMSSGADRPLRVRGHTMFLAPPGKYPAPDMMADRYEEATVRLFEELLQPGMAVMDIGAHVGYFSLISARLVGPQGKVIAFEPEPENHNLLIKNIESNGYSNISPIPKAVSSTSGTTQFFLSALDNGSHSIFLPGARGVIDSISVETTTVDDFLDAQGWPQVDLFKVDVEGAESEVLEGMTESVVKNPAANLVVEFCPYLIRRIGGSPPDLLEKIRSLGFQINLIDDSKGVLAAETFDVPNLISRLMRQEGYVNLFCSREK